ncbi:hypothetical protein [Treponema primitia]|uniref:hypothetical protein n=1 Tax=Treponema primitia TaxID=88058 RepID=UPI001FDFB3F4|nr:hypothetical protein [Treponema primitia]
MVETSPERPLLDGSWRVSILVDHPNPDEVNVSPPDLPSSITFAQVRKETRLIRTTPEEGTRWTLVEFLFVPQRTGTISLGAFEVSIPGKRVFTRALRTYVVTQEGGREEYHPRLSWESYPPSIKIGESVELTLRIIDWDPDKTLAHPAFQETAPADALLEELPLSKADLDQGLVLRLRLTPLEGTRVSLDPFSLRFNTLSLEAPAISIRLNPPGAAAAPGPAPVDRSGTEEPAPLASGPAPANLAFPETPLKVFPLFRKAYGETLDKARTQWLRGEYSGALGELRRGERDLLAGPALVVLRRAAETALGLTETEDEKWQPLGFSLGLVVISFFLLILVIWRFFYRNRKRNKVTSLSLWGFRIVLLTLLAILGWGIMDLGKIGGISRNGALQSAVLHACEAYRVPDTNGAVSARWREGQPVKVRTVGKLQPSPAANLWAYAESPGGDAGWVHQDNIIFY